MALRLPPPQRTQGDGMEKTDPEQTTEHDVVLHPQEFNDNIMRESHTGSVGQCLEKLNLNETAAKKLETAVKLTPHTVKKKNDHGIKFSFKNKEPKFVPYEPYKAAVKPIVPSDKKNSLKMLKKPSKGFPLVFTNKNSTDEIKVIANDSLESKSSFETDWEVKKSILETEIKTLREENEQLENQLKFQVQVNGELKNLLVAAVGEDMETKVHILTEDKLHLAQALLNSAKSLSTHQEQTEWLAGQCEVWRSKFLASSVMVEELARWKAALSQKVNEANDVIKRLLEDHNEVREYLFRTHGNLCFLRDSFDLHHKRDNLLSSNILDVSGDNLKLSQVLVIQLLGSEKLPYSHCDALRHLPNQTIAEKAAENMLSNPHLLHLIREPDIACNAVVGAAVALSGQLYLQSHPPKIECCPQCSGEIKLL